MTLVSQPLETMDYVTATAVASPAAETAILSTDVIQAYANPADQQPGSEVIAPQVVRPVIVEANINVTPGAAATALVVRCRQGIGIAGAQVGFAYSPGVTAAVPYQGHFKFRDTSGVPFAPGGSAYTITIAETSATGAGSVNAIDVEVRQ